MQDYVEEMTEPMGGGDESLKMASVNSVFTADSDAVEPALGAVGAFLGGMLLLWLVCFVVALAIMFYGSKFMVEHYGVKGNMSIGVYLAYFFLAPVWWVALMIAGFQRVFGGAIDISFGVDLFSCRRTNHEYVPLTSLDHLRQHRLSHVQHSFDVAVDHRVPII